MNGRSFLPRLDRAYKTFGHAGLAAGSTLALGLAAARGRSLPLVLVALAAGYVVSYVLTLGTKVVRGREQLVYYHYLVLVGGCAALVPWLAGEPAADHLEVVVLGLGLMQACGRLGCWRVGCCHGRPWGWGVRYGEAHRRMGFPAYLVGVRLFPVQALEATWAVGVVALGSSLVLRGAPAGAGLAVYLVGYPAGRFLLELFRGDARRPFRLGFSEAQWISLALIAGTLVAGAAGRLPRVPYLAAAGTATLLAAGVVAAWTRCGRDQRTRLLASRHVQELGECLIRLHREGPLAGAPGVRLATTSSGLRISTGTVRQGRRISRLYTLSLLGRPLRRTTAAALGRLLVLLHHPGGKGRLVTGRRRIFHVLVERPWPRTAPVHEAGRMVR